MDSVWALGLGLGIWSLEPGVWKAVVGGEYAVVGWVLKLGWVLETGNRKLR